MLGRMRRAQKQMTDPKLTDNARTVLEKRYLWRDDEGKIVETPAELFARVAKAIAQPEKRERGKWEARFLDFMVKGRFIPNTPTLINAGRKKGQLSACFVLPVEDSLDSIFDTLKGAAKIHQSGGGTGFAFSRLRPEGSIVRSTHGVASGPVSFIKIYDISTETIKQGGARRGANMAILRVDHPDIETFIDSKRDFRSILNFNISVGATAEFMTAVERGAEFALRDPVSGNEVRKINARALFDRMVQAAWECGDPGLVFLDRINLFNPTPQVGEMESTNPCVTGDTRIWVEGKGLLPIRECVGKHPRVSTQHAEGQGFRGVTQVVRTGIKPVFRLKTYEGYELRLTADHRVRTENGDVPACDLEAGDRVQLLKVENPRVDQDSIASRQGEAVGWLVGDGHFTQHEEGKPTVVLSFYGEDKREAAPRVLRTVTEWIGDDRIGLNAVESRDMEYVRSQRLLFALKEFGVDAECKKSIPEVIWRGSTELVSGFLRGLFSADGSFQGTLEKGLSVRLASSEEALLRDTQLLLLRLGVKSALYRNRRKAGARMMPDSRGEPREYHCAAQHELVISKGSLRTFASSVGFMIRRKQDQLESAIASYRRGPYKDVFFATVEELVPEGEEEVFDLSEPDTRHFHANGLLVHNCGEQPLLPYESCNLGSLNLGAYYDAGKGFAWELYRDDIHLATRFLDNVIDCNEFPLAECRKITLRNRKIGLGVMGFADLLLMMGLPYDSAEARRWGERLMAFLDREAKTASRELAVKRGPFPNWKGSFWQKLGYKPMRNATVSTVAPTGTISIIAGCSSGIEPIFAGIFYRNVLSGSRLREVHPAVARVLKERGKDATALSEDRIGEAVGRAWSPAQSVPVEAHVRMQALFQRHSDSSVSKTINLPKSASVQDVANAYLLAYRLGCKGITVYRDGSRPEQVLEREDPAEASSVAEAPSCPSC